MLTKLWGLVAIATVLVWLYLNGDRLRNLGIILASTILIGTIYLLMAWAWAPSTFSIVGGEAAREWGSFSFILAFLEDPMILASFAATLILAGGLGGRDSRSDLLVTIGIVCWVLIFALFHFRFYYIVEYAPLMFLALSQAIDAALSRFRDQPGRSVFSLLLIGFPPLLWALTSSGLQILQIRLIILGLVATWGVALLVTRPRMARAGQLLAGLVIVVMIGAPFAVQGRSWDQVVRGRFFGRVYWTDTLSMAEMAAAATFLKERIGGSTSVVANPLLLAQLPSDMSRRGRPYQSAPPWSARYPDYAVVDDLWRTKHARPAVEAGIGVPTPVAGWQEVFRSGTVAVLQNPLTLR